MDAPTPTIVTGREAAAMLRLSERTLMRLAADGRGPRRIRLSSRRVAYVLDDLHRWIAERAGRDAA